MALESMQEIFDKTAGGEKPFWRVILETDRLSTPNST